MADSTNPIDAARAINKDVMSWFGFDPRYYYHPTDQGLAEMRDKHKGRCEDMTNLAIYAMRSTGPNRAGIKLELSGQNPVPGTSPTSKKP